MAKIEIKDALFPDCPIRNILSRIGDKWSLLVLYTLSSSSVMRFNVLQKNIPDISQKMLTVTLRALEEDGLVKRVIYAEVPPRAKSLLPCIDSLIAWAGENMAAILNDRMRSKVG